MGMFRDDGRQWWVGYSLNALGVLSLSRGDMHHASELFSESLTVQRHSGNTTGASYTLVNLAKLARAAGEFDTARRLYAESLQVRVEQNDILGIASCLRGLASMALAGGDDDRAAQLYGAAERLSDDTGAYLAETARVRYLAVIDGLRARMGEAAFADRWAVGRAMSRAETVELALAAETTANDPLVPPELAAPDGMLSGLSPREHDVLRLLAAGRSNRDIAAELFISHRTVETHVARILAKLSVESRAAAAIWAIQRGAT
jgi:DNA-binding CsgD family transcriptional regulator